MGRAITPRSTRGLVIAAAMMTVVAAAAYVWLMVLPRA
jgi:hypothetical protein